MHWESSHYYAHKIHPFAVVKPQGRTSAALSNGKEGVKRFNSRGHTAKQKVDTAAPLPPSLPLAAAPPLSTQQLRQAYITQVPLSPTVSLPHLCDVKQFFCFLFKTLASGAIIGKKGSWGAFIWKNPFKESQAVQRSAYSCMSSSMVICLPESNPTPTHSPSRPTTNWEPIEECQPSPKKNSPANNLHGAILLKITSTFLGPCASMV